MAEKSTAKANILRRIDDAASQIGSSKPKQRGARENIAKSTA